MQPQAREAFLSRLSLDEAQYLYYDWSFWSRAEQRAPAGDWRAWWVLAGRGFGKTRAGAEFVRQEVEAKRARRVALIAETAGDARDVMVEGESGILACSPPWFMPLYEPSKRRLTWPNGAIATTYSGDTPDQLRGPNHDLAWADEPAKWRYPERAWDNMQFGLRLGLHPRVVATTTPRPIKFIKDALADRDTVKTGGNTYENRDNLAGPFLQYILRKYEGTRLGRQELHAVILDDNPNALWKRTEMIDAYRWEEAVPALVRVGVAIDPPGTSGEEAAEAGIIAGGVDARGHAYILEDVSRQASPNAWGHAAVAVYNKVKGDRIIGETNNGGEMVENTIRMLRNAADEPIGKYIPFKAVHASRGKYTRAEPIASLYEQGLVHHVGQFAALEDQLCTWQPGDDSPDRLDALVWLLTELMLGDEQVQTIVTNYRGR